MTHAGQTFRTRGARLGARFAPRFAWVSLLAPVLLVGQAASPTPAATPSPKVRAAAARAPYQFSVTSALVVVNVVARDRNGALVTGLTAADFRVSEDGKPQTLTTFEYDHVPATAVAERESAPEAAPPGNAVATPVSTAAAAPPPAARTITPVVARDHRLIVLFFDLSSMQPEDVDHAIAAARNYVAKQMSPADMVAVASLGTALNVNLDFTTDRALLNRALTALNSPSGEGFEAGSTGTTEGTADTGGSFTADETEFNIFDTDRELAALESLANMLGGIKERKSVVYFSGGLTRTGVENQTVLRAATDALVKNNVAVYPLDIRGLQALPPGGEAQNASLRGTSPYSGGATRNALASNFGSQETLVSLASDTGGRAFLDTNDFGKVFSKVQADSEAFYVLGYHSNDLRQDGRFRKITVRCLRKGVRLEYRAGYFAPKDFSHFTREDKTRQITDELDAPLPDTNLPIFLSAGYFRVGFARFYVPVSIAIPGAALRAANGSESLTIAGAIRAPDGEPVGQINHTLDLRLDAAALRARNVQYDTGFLLPPGDFDLRIIVRDNVSGEIGSFETPLRVPEFAFPAPPAAGGRKAAAGNGGRFARPAALDLSSILIGSQVVSAPPGKPSQAKDDPLAGPNQPPRVIPNVTHVFAANQRLYVYFEVYNAAEADAGGRGGRRGAPADLLTNVEFLDGGIRRYQTREVALRRINNTERGAAVFELDIPLAKVPPGLYTCQVNVIDNAAARFAFPRFAILVRPPAPIS